MLYAMLKFHEEHGLLKREPRWITCPECDGAGTTRYDIPGGSFDTREGQWFPTQGTYTCETCDGTGEVEERDEDE